MNSTDPNGVDVPRAQLESSRSLAGYQDAMRDVHAMLDELGAPREANGATLYVRERIKALASGVETPTPCPACGSEERGQGGYLSCECPAVSIPGGQKR